MFVSETNTYSKHGFIYDIDGCLYGFGNNSLHQLGLDNAYYVNIPELIMVDKDIKKIHRNMTNSILVKDDGDVFITGPLGENYYKKFTFLLRDENIKEIYTRSGSLIILNKNGCCYSYRQGKKCSELDNIKLVCPIDLATYGNLLILTKAGELYFCNNYDNGYIKQTQVIVGNFSNLHDITIIEKNYILWYENKLIMTDCISELNNGQIIHQSNNIVQILCCKKSIYIIEKDNKIYKFSYRLTTDSITATNKLLKGVTNARLNIDNFDAYNFFQNLFNQELNVDNFDENSGINCLNNLLKDFTGNRECKKDEYKFKYKGQINHGDCITSFDDHLLIIENINQEELQSTCIDIWKSKHKYDKIFPLIYDQNLLIVGSGTIINKFDPDQFQNLNNYLRDAIKTSLLCFHYYRVDKTHIPKYIRFKIYQHLLSHI